jgi:hypothetical protein
MLILLGFVPQRQPTTCSQLLFSDSLRPLNNVDEAAQARQKLAQRW